MGRGRKDGKSTWPRELGCARYVDEKLWIPESAAVAEAGP
jgi:hypothetical protein